MIVLFVLSLGLHISLQMYLIYLEKKLIYLFFFLFRVGKPLFSSSQTPEPSQEKIKKDDQKNK